VGIGRRALPEVESAMLMQNQGISRVILTECVLRLNFYRFRADDISLAAVWRKRYMQTEGGTSAEALLRADEYSRRGLSDFHATVGEKFSGAAYRGEQPCIPWRC